MHQTPLQEIIDGFERKHGERNRCFLHQRGDILLFLANARLRLGKQIRAGDTPKRELLASVGSVFSRTIALANSFGNLDIVSALCKKYPLSRCAYCGKKPCECDVSKRNPIKEEVELSDAQMKWSIWEWSRHLKKVYGAANHERGIDYILGRLTEEFLEASDEEFVAQYSFITTSRELREKLAKEISDVFAWTFGLANELDVNLDGLARAWAFKKCKDCKKLPCECSPFRFISS